MTKDRSQFEFDSLFEAELKYIDTARKKDLQSEIKALSQQEHDKESSSLQERKKALECEMAAIDKRLKKNYSSQWEDSLLAKVAPAKGISAPPPPTIAQQVEADNSDQDSASADDEALLQFQIHQSEAEDAEPFASFLNRDLVGMAFSGGGIRSATFNLGVLQGLHDLKLLRLTDYLSTVSGGGYIGGWWTAWRQRGGGEEHAFFPQPRGAQENLPGHERQEPEEVRHLREFSNFLSPRLGFFSTGMWNGIIAILSGLLPTLLMAISVLSSALLFFLVVAFLFFWPADFSTVKPVAEIGYLAASWQSLQSVLYSGVPILFVTTFVLLLTFERKYRKQEHAQPLTNVFVPFFHLRYSLGGALFSALILLVLLTLRPLPEPQRSENDSVDTNQASTVADTGQPLQQSSWHVHAVKTFPGQLDRVPLAQAEPPRQEQPAPDRPQAPSSGDNAKETMLLAIDLLSKQLANQQATPPRQFFFQAKLLYPAAAWLLAAVVLITFRYFADWSSDIASQRSYIAAISRIAGRLGKAALLWILFVGVWELSRWLFPTDEASGWLLASGGGSLAIGATLFRYVAHWLSQSSSSDSDTKLTGQIKALLPQALAYGVIGLSMVLLCWSIRESHLLSESLIPQIEAGFYSLLLLLGLFVAVLALQCKLVNPRALGLHAFYRNRLARTYLGASNDQLSPGCASAADNRVTVPLEEDDLPFADPQNSKHPWKERRPFHLVSCAANDVGGDHLANLGRGSRSATLSPLAFSIGKYWATQDDMTLATAQTASAAAFNSNMGSLSMRLGPGVTFLLAALNLRLGIWLRHPKTGIASPHRPLKGWRLLVEMLSHTTSSFFPQGKLQSQDVHLSDGAHFENLALYELVRRHCRYIIVSDCGADPETAFDDFGNALRRIREDFGVEIEIDISPLKPGEDGLAKQHMAVGTIHYDRKNDKGILLYFKPNFTGDEPDDVTQYRTRNEVFPNETTVDQFYDEAQWESYRRLGEHSARSALRFSEQLDHPQGISAQKLFTEAYWNWLPTPPALQQAMLEQTERFTQFQAKLRHQNCYQLIHEICPEIEKVGPAAAYRTIPLEELIPLLTELAQLMEDIFVACQLETHLSHPLNHGWHNLFWRWARALSFRRWWPLLCPLYSRQFRQFMNRHFELDSRSFGEANGNVGKLQHATVGSDEREDLLEGFAAQQFQAEPLQPRNLTTTDLFSFELDMATDVNNGQAPSIQIAFAAIQRKDKIASWHVDDLYVPPGLWGTGVGTSFLRALCTSLSQQQEPMTACRVRLTQKQTPNYREPQQLQESDQANRAAHADLIRFYTAVGFELRLAPPPNPAQPAEQYLWHSLRADG